MGKPKAAPEQVARRSYSIAEMAARHNLSKTYMYDEVAAGRLRVVRPRPDGDMRVLPEDEEKWLQGKATA